MAARSNPHSTINQVRDVFPKLGELTDKLLFGARTSCAATSGVHWRTASRARRSAR